MVLHSSTHLTMKKLNCDIDNYIHKRLHTNLESIHAQLMSLAIINDVTVFDFKSHTTLVFFGRLYDLMTFIDIDSTTIWICIEVLMNACKDNATRACLVRKFNFIPALTRFLSNHLTTEKKKLLLTILRDLSCGVKLVWHTPRLDDLLRTITDWFEAFKEDEEIVTLSLTILVNLCMKNTPAMFILTRVIDVKKLLRVCISLKGAALEMNTTKLIIIFESMNNLIPPEKLFEKLIVNTFNVLVDESQSAMDVEQTVDFVIDICERDVYKPLWKTYQFKAAMDSWVANGIVGDGLYDCQRLGAIIKFFNYLLDNAYVQLKDYHAFLLDLGVKWSENRDLLGYVSEFLTIFTLHGYEGITDKITSQFPVFIAALDAQRTDNSTKIAIIMLLRALLSINSRNLVLSRVKDIITSQIFHNPLNNDCLDDENVALYVNVIALVEDLSKCDTKCSNLHSMYKESENVHKIIAYSLLHGTKDLKRTPIECFRSFAVDRLVRAIESLKVNDCLNANTQKTHEMFLAPFTIVQSELLDDCLERLRALMTTNNGADIAASDIMEIYEYKLSELSNAERAARTKLNFFCEEWKKEENRTVLLDDQLIRMRQVLYAKQKEYENSMRINAEQVCYIRELTNKCDSERGRINVMKRSLIEMTAAKEEFEEKCLCVAQDYQKAQQILRLNEKSMEKSNERVEGLTAKVADLERQVQDLRIELDAERRESEEKGKIVESITRLAASINSTSRDKS